MWRKKMNCALWGVYATQLVDYVINNKNVGEHIILLIQNAKIKQWQKLPQVSNQLFGCRVHLNTDVPPILAYKQALLDKDDDVIPSSLPDKISPSTIVYDALEYFKKFPVTTLDTIRASVQESTVTQALNDEGWFTYSCNRCNTKARRKLGDGHVNMEFECSQCGKLLMLLESKLCCTIVYYFLPF